MTTLRAFQKNRLPNNEKIFKLVGVQARFEGRSLEELDPADQRRFQDAAIHATIIQQSNPRNDHSSIYHIFERLNSGGTPLQPQEMRAAIYHGSFQNLLNELNELDAWRAIFGPKNKRGKDQELILRFLSFRFDRENYRSPMKSFLNSFMGKYQSVKADTAETFRKDFASSVSRAHAALGSKAFRPAKVLNAAVFDSILTAISNNPSLQSDAILAAYLATISDPNYIEAVSKSTSDESNVHKRFQIADAYFGDATRN